MSTRRCLRPGIDPADINQESGIIEFVLLPEQVPLSPNW